MKPCPHDVILITILSEVCVDVFLVLKYAVGVCDLWILSFWEKAGNELPQLERLI